MIGQIQFTSLEANASTFTGRGVLQGLLRHLLRSRCRLGAFARSLLAWQFAPSTEEVTGSAELFPFPLPYPEVFQSSMERFDKRNHAEERHCSNCHRAELPLFA